MQFVQHVFAEECRLTLAELLHGPLFCWLTLNMFEQNRNMHRVITNSHSKPGLLYCVALHLGKIMNFSVDAKKVTSAWIVTRVVALKRCQVDHQYTFITHFVSGICLLRVCSGNKGLTKLFTCSRPVICN